MSGRLYQHTLVPTAEGQYLNGTIQTGDIIIRNEANSTRLKELKLIGERRSLTADTALQRILVSVGERSSTFIPIDFSRADRLLVGSGGCVGLRLDEVMYRLKVETYGIVIFQGFVFFYQPSGDRIWCDSRDEGVGDDIGDGTLIIPDPPTICLDGTCAGTDGDEDQGEADDTEDHEGNPMVCGGSMAPDGILHISWSAVAGATAYKVDIYSGSSCEGNPILTVFTDSQTFLYSLDCSLLASGSYSFDVTAVGNGVDQDSVTSECCAFGVCPTIALDDILPDSVVGAAYSGTIQASGGIAPYTYALTSGSLPAGLTLASDGTVSGTPTGVETANFTVTATDANGCTGSKEYVVLIFDGSAAPCVIPEDAKVDVVINGLSQVVSLCAECSFYTVQDGDVLWEGNAVWNTPNDGWMTPIMSWYPRNYFSDGIANLDVPERKVIRLVGCVWELTLQGGVGGPWWTGVKTVGQTARGIYTKTAGYSSGPAILIVT